MAEKTTSKASCRKALESAEDSLMSLPGVVGLGIVRDASKKGHKVALYVSGAKSKTKLFPKSIKVPDSTETVETDIREIGEVELESEIPKLGKEG